MNDRQSTHASGCWDWGPRHYGCAVGEIERLRAENSRLRAELEKWKASPHQAAAGHATCAEQAKRPAGVPRADVK